MRKDTVYTCECCGKVFNNSTECEQHERICNKCNSCKNAYYVYGCEFTCKYNDAGKCGKPQTGVYPFYEKKISIEKYK